MRYLVSDPLESGFGERYIATCLLTQLSRQSDDSAILDLDNRVATEKSCRCCNFDRP